MGAAAAAVAILHRAGFCIEGHTLLNHLQSFQEGGHYPILEPDVLVQHERVAAGFEEAHFLLLPCLCTGRRKRFVKITCLAVDPTLMMTSYPAVLLGAQVSLVNPSVPSEDLDTVGHGLVSGGLESLRNPLSWAAAPFLVTIAHLLARISHCLCNTLWDFAMPPEN